MGGQQQTAESGFLCGSNKHLHYKTSNIITNSKPEVYICQKEGKDSMKLFIDLNMQYGELCLLGERSIKMAGYYRTGLEVLGY
jgi:hypothetical protein